MSQKVENNWTPPLPIPSHTTFGSAPVVSDEIGCKAYRSWLLVRFLYEVCRWICWTWTVAGIVETVQMGIRVPTPLGT